MCIKEFDVPVYSIQKFGFSKCDEWGGAESRGNGARPVEWMIMNDTCATHRSRVPRRSSGRNKRRSDNSGRRERTRPGFYFMFCVWQSSVRGCRFSVMFVYFVIKMWLSVRRFPPPSSRIYELRYIGAEAREEGGTRCQRALAAEWDRGAEKIGQQEVAETASGCPKRWCWSKRRTGGTEDSLPCSWVEEGWLPSERERRSRPVRLEAEACCHPPCLGRSRERGTRCRLPSTRGATAVRQEADEHRAVHQRGPVPSHGTASEPLSWLRTERQCVREPDRVFFSSLPSLVSVTPHPSVSFLSPRLSLPPGTPRPPWRAPPGRGGRGGVERSLVSTPRPARGDGGMWRVGRGREPWERSEAGGVNDNERHLRHSPVSSPTEELRKE